ncbi:MAG: hypothetical protein D8M57_19995 [Candidatus Scalindua sp. AMX11]|nr:hypothetical protein [Planctomycetota bacterium]RZV60525.1 MAG: hypothetical protein EX341_19230 [Candidatus Scalindua sp. SCAELEC01]TDE63116.1 MAG: hypothetical protein D8M57_19995 [Candidatus Scalindua sp. AMX11]GJQ57564.1 MAG: hypothetical protein SCALA701_03650 [Candidatus Scalindua sp.]
MDMRCPFITFSRLGKHGRLGNQLFQIAVVIAHSKKFGISAKFPKWHCKYDNIYYSDFFKNKIDESLQLDLIPHVKVYREPFFHYTEIPKQINTDFYGYFQSDKYFNHCLEEIKKLFEPKEAMIEQISEKYKNLTFSQICSIHIRRGDYIGSVHEICNIDYYRACCTNPISPQKR